MGNICLNESVVINSKKFNILVQQVRNYSRYALLPTAEILTYLEMIMGKFGISNPLWVPRTKIFVDFIDTYENIQTAKQEKSPEKKFGRFILASNILPSRTRVENDPETLYIFTDNLGRSSGKNLINPKSNYAKKYAETKEGIKRQLFYPGLTSALIRGLNNAFPISTMVGYTPGGDVSRNRWVNVERAKEEIDKEIESIKEAWNTGKYKRIIMRNPIGSSISDISESSLNEQRRELARYLQKKIQELKIMVEGEKTPLDTLLDVSRILPTNIDNDTIFQEISNPSINSANIEKEGLKGIPINWSIFHSRFGKFKEPFEELLNEALTDKKIVINNLYELLGFINAILYENGKFRLGASMSEEEIQQQKDTVISDILQTIANQKSLDVFYYDFNYAVTANNEYTSTQLQNFLVPQIIKNLYELPGSLLRVAIQELKGKLPSSKNLNTQQIISVIEALNLIPLEVPELKSIKYKNKSYYTDGNVVYDDSILEIEDTLVKDIILMAYEFNGNRADTITLGNTKYKVSPTGKILEISTNNAGETELKMLRDNPIKPKANLRKRFNYYDNNNYIGATTGAVLEVVNTRGLGNQTLRSILFISGKSPSSGKSKFLGRIEDYGPRSLTKNEKVDAFHIESVYSAENTLNPPSNVAKLFIDSLKKQGKKDAILYITGDSIPAMPAGIIREYIYNIIKEIQKEIPQLVIVSDASNVSSIGAIEASVRLNIPYYVHTTMSQKDVETIANSVLPEVGTQYSADEQGKLVMEIVLKANTIKNLGSTGNLTISRRYNPQVESSDNVIIIGNKEGLKNYEGEAIINSGTTLNDPEFEGTVLEGYTLSENTSIEDLVYTIKPNGENTLTLAQQIGNFTRIDLASSSFAYSTVKLEDEFILSLSDKKSDNYTRLEQTKVGDIVIISDPNSKQRFAFEVLEEFKSAGSRILVNKKTIKLKRISNSEVNSYQKGAEVYKKLWDIYFSQHPAEKEKILNEVLGKELYPGESVKDIFSPASAISKVANQKVIQLARLRELITTTRNDSRTLGIRQSFSTVNEETGETEDNVPTITYMELLLEKFPPSIRLYRIDTAANWMVRAIKSYIGRKVNKWKDMLSLATSDLERHQILRLIQEFTPAKAISTMGNSAIKLGLIQDSGSEAKSGMDFLFKRYTEYLKRHIQILEDSLTRRVNVFEELQGNSPTILTSDHIKSFQYAKAQYVNLVENIDLLRPLIVDRLASLCGFKVKTDYSVVTLQDINLQTSQNEEDDPEEQYMTGEEGKKGSNYGDSIENESGFDKLSKVTRRALEDINLVSVEIAGNNTRKYKPVTDDLGNPLLLSPQQGHAVLMEILIPATKPDDIIPLLQAQKDIIPWLPQIIDKITPTIITKNGEIPNPNYNEELHNALFVDFFKVFMPYRIVLSQRKETNTSESTRFATKDINRLSSVDYLFNYWQQVWTSNSRGGNARTSIFGSNLFNIQNLNEVNNKIATLIDNYREVTTSGENRVKMNPKDITILHKLMSDIGLIIDKKILEFSLHSESNKLIKDDSTGEWKTISNYKYKSMLADIGKFVAYLVQKAPEYNASLSADPTSKDFKSFYDIFLDFLGRNGYISTIANHIKGGRDLFIEASAYERGKSYYSYVVPSDLALMIKSFRTGTLSRKELEQLILDKYGKYDWFYDKTTGKYRLDILNDLLNPKSDLRELLDHCQIIHLDLLDYSRWAPVLRVAIAIEQYNSGGDSGYAWFMTPTMSDSPAHEYLRLRKIVGKDIEETKEMIIEKLVPFVLQETERIKLVKAREGVIERGKRSEIAAFDIGAKKGGNGALYHFFPQFNSPEFIEGLKQAAANTGDITEYIKLNLRRVLDEGFEEALQTWILYGLLDPIEGSNNLKYISGALPWRALDNLMVAYDSVFLKLLTFDTNKISEFDELLKLYEKIKTQVSSRVFPKTKELKELRQKVLDIMYIVDPTGEIFNTPISEYKNTTVHKVITTYNNQIVEKLEEFYYNSVLATATIAELTITDPAYYPSIKEFVKRFKQVHAPGQRINTDATWKGERVFAEKNPTDKVLIIKDSKIKGMFLNALQPIVESLADSKNLKISKETAKAIIATLEEITETDGLTFRSLDSYVRLAKGFAKWDDYREEAYQRLKAGKFSLQDFSIVFNTVKPYVFSDYTVKSGLKRNSDGEYVEVDDSNPDNDEILIKNHIQIKTSEFPLLLAALMHSAVNMREGSDGNYYVNFEGEDVQIAANSNSMGALIGLALFINNPDNGVDCITFESSVKVGAQAVIELPENPTAANMISTLTNALIAHKNNPNLNIIKEILIKDYRIQQETPEHFVDESVLIGTQFRRLIGAAAPNSSITVAGITLTKKLWQILYNAVICANVGISLLDVAEIFSSPEKLSKFLQSELAGNERYSLDFKAAVSLVKDANGIADFLVPLSCPAFANLTEQLLTSLLKKKVVNLKMTGGSLIQVSSWGISTDLKCVWEDTPNGRRLVGVECYMPASSKELLEYLMDENGILDVNKLPEELREAIGYRIPTDDLHSMAPLIIKGFTPPYNGGVVMLPAEYIAISGSDFDIDKLYVLLPAMNIDKPSPQDAARAFSQLSDNELKKVIKEVLKSTNPELDIESLGIDELDRKQLEPYIKQIYRPWVKKYIKDNTVVSKILYDKGKLTGNSNDVVDWLFSLSKHLRDNLFFDLARSVLTHPDNLVRMFTPVSFELHSKVGAIATILRKLPLPTIRKIAKDKLTKYVDNEGKPEDSKNSYMDLFSTLSLRELDDIVEEYIGNNKIFSAPDVLIDQQHDNMTGKVLVGVEALNIISHSMTILVNINFFVNEDKGGHKMFSFGAYAGQSSMPTSLSNITNEELQSIQDLIAGFVNAATDNGKNPRLGDLNQHIAVAGATVMLVRLGYSLKDVSLLLNSPVLRRLTKDIGKFNGAKTADALLEEYQIEYNDAAGLEIDSKGRMQQHSSAGVVHFLTRKGLENGIIMQRYVEDPLYENNKHKKEWYESQAVVASLMREILFRQESLRALVDASKGDSSNGAGGPSLAELQFKVQKVRKYEKSNFGDKVKDGSRVFTKESNVFHESHIKIGFTDVDQISFDKDSAREEIKEFIKELLENEKTMPIAYLQMFTSAGNIAAYDILVNYFPEIKILEALEQNLLNITGRKYVSADLNKKLKQQFIYYCLTGTKFFKSDFQTRASFINSFPEYFNAMKVRFPNEIGNNKFILQLVVVDKGKNRPVATVQLPNTGNIKGDIRQQLEMSWMELLTADNPEIRKFGFQLIQYSYFRNGGYFGPGNFGHLLSPYILASIPQYKERLKDIATEFALGGEDTVKRFYSNFFDLFVRNNLEDKELVPEIGPANRSIQFIHTEEETSKKGKGTFKDLVIIPEITDKDDPQKKVIVNKRTILKDGSIKYTYKLYLKKKAIVLGVERVAYYKYMGKTPDNTGVIYQMISPLGKLYQFLEYDINDPAMTTAVPQKTQDIYYGEVVESSIPEEELKQLQNEENLQNNLETSGDGSEDKETLTPDKNPYIDEFQPTEDQTDSEGAESCAGSKGDHPFAVFV